MRLGASTATLFLGLTTPVLAMVPGAAAAGPATVARDGIARVSPEEVLRANVRDHDQQSDHVWDPATVVPVTLPRVGGASSRGVTETGGVVTIHSAGTYLISGDMEGGQVVVSAGEGSVVRLVLDNARISCQTSAPILVTRAAKVVVVLRDGTSNYLVGGLSGSGGVSDPNRPIAALFSTVDLTITGRGALEVLGTAAHGIVSRAGLVIDSGSLKVKAAADGIIGGDYVVVRGGTIAVTAGRDGLISNNTQDPAQGYLAIDDGAVTIKAIDDGMTAATDIVVNGGTLAVTTGSTEGRSTSKSSTAKGLRVGADLAIGAGAVTIDAAGDGIDVEYRAAVSGGAVTIASGRDGLHADFEVDISGGKFTVTKSYEAIEALEVEIRGGQIALAASNDGVNASSSETTGNRQPLMTISGGFLRTWGGDDGLDSNGSLLITGGEIVLDAMSDGIDTDGGTTITGGKVVISGAEDDTQYKRGLDISGPISLKGGTILVGAAAAVGRRPPADSPQGWVEFWFDSPQEPGTVIQVVDHGQVIVSWVAKKWTRSLFFSSSKIHKGQWYDFYVGGRPTGGGLGGMHPSGDLSGALRMGDAQAGK